MPTTIQIRFYEELNDFLPRKFRKTIFEHSFNGNMTIKDIIEAIGVPHTEIDLILANGKSEDFLYKPGENDLISVYPLFESLDISNVTRLRPKPLRETKFILDVHLGKLAKYLRMIGFDTLYENDYTDPFIIDMAIKDKRIILTRDIGILKNKQVTHGYYVRETQPKKQLSEVIDRFDLQNNINVLSLCMECNGRIANVEKERIIDQLQPKTRKYFHDFFQCTSCKKIYWEGSHYKNMLSQVRMVRNSK
jgi:uncharacterized protein with PIN domain